MHTTVGSRSRLEAGVSLFAVSLVAWLAGSLVGGTASGWTPPSAGTGASTHVVPAGGGALRIELLVGDDVVTATLADTPAAREFAATLPITIDTEDRFGQAKTGELPHELFPGDDEPVVDPAPGGLYYWSPDRTLAVVTTDLGPFVPAPGLVRLGAVDAGLDMLDSAGNHFQMTIRPAA
jgi:hypothetical protein